MTKTGKTDAHRARKAESRKRGIQIETPLSLIDAILNASDDSLAGVEAAFYTDIYAGGIVGDDYPHRLYAPGLRSLTDLPPALLDSKETLPPLELIPDSSRALDVFLRRLVLIGIADADLRLATAGWPKQASTMSPWLHHVMRVWAWHDRDPALYKALVGGRFEPVIRHLRSLNSANPALAATLRRDLHVQALIWCAHDAQMVVARLAISDAVFGPLLKTDKLKLSPEGVRNRLIERRVILETILDLVYGSPDWREGDLPPPDFAGISDDPVTSNPVMSGLARRVEQRAKAAGLSPDAIAVELAPQFAAIAARWRENDPELALSQLPTDDERKERSLPAVWYGLSPVAAAAVPILRLVRAEQLMPALIDEQVSLSNDISEARGGSGLPPFDPDALKNWHERARQLLDLYRRKLLRDVDYVRVEEKDFAERKAKAEAGAEVFKDLNDPKISLDPWKAMGAAQNSLKVQARFATGDNHGDGHDERKPLYMLDVLPKYRFHEGHR